MSVVTTVCIIFVEHFTCSFDGVEFRFMSFDPVDDHVSWVL